MELIVIHSFLTHEECDFLRHQHVGVHIENDAYWSDRTMWDGIIWRKSICLKLVNLENVVSHHYHTPVRLTSPHLVKWPEGHPGMPPHSDYGADSAYLHREYSAVVSLNDEYEGGQSLFPELNKTITLDKGDLIICNGGKVLHGVGPIAKADRYTMLMWFIPTEQFSPYIDPLPLEFTSLYE